MKPPKKLPRVSAEKYLRGGASGRRTTVAALGDSLRELGAVRLEGWGRSGDRDESGPSAGEDLQRLARLVLEALEEYFGLLAGSLAGLPREGAAAAPESSGGGEPYLLAIWHGPGVAALAARLPSGGVLPTGAREGELVVFAGPALEAVTHGRIPAGRWEVGGEATREAQATDGAGAAPNDRRSNPHLILPDPNRALDPLPELLGP